MKDKSPQGYIDEDIKDLLALINSDENFKTTSSCSGRIVLLNTQNKKESKWIFKSHEPINFESFYKSLPKGKFYFMQEPLIVHVKCADLKSAERLLKISYELGLKHSGIISIKNLVVEIRDNKRIETVIDKELVSKEYLKFLVEEANKKLTITKNNIKKLEKKLKI